MTIIASIDGPNRNIYLHADTVGTSVHPIDIYKEMRTLRRTNEELRKYNIFLQAKGNEDKGSGKATERFVICLEGTRIIPYDTSHQITIIGTIITDDGQEGIACFDRAPLTPSTIIDIAYVPPQVEVITITGGSGLDVEQDSMLRSIYANTELVLYYDFNNTQFGDGSVQNPFNNVAGLIDYSNLKNIKNIQLFSDITLDRNMEGFTVRGSNHETINCAGFSIDSSFFYDIDLAGIATGRINAKHCAIKNGFTGLDGHLTDCDFGGLTKIADGAFVLLDNCFSGVMLPNKPIFDLQNSVTTSISCSGYAGCLAVRNVAGSVNIIGFNEGSIELENTCVAGDIYLRGNARVLDTSNGSTVYTDCLLQPSNVKIDTSVPLDANVKQVNGTAVKGNGTPGNEWGPLI